MTATERSDFTTEVRQPTPVETLKEVLDFLVRTGNSELAHRFGAVTAQISERLTQASAKASQSAEALARSRAELESLRESMGDQERRHESALAAMVVEERAKLAGELATMLESERRRVEGELVAAFEEQKAEAVDNATRSFRAEVAALEGEASGLRASLEGERAVRDFTVMTAVAEERSRLEGEIVALRRAKDTTEVVLRHMFVSIEEAARSASAESERLNGVVARHKPHVEAKMPWTSEAISQIRDTFTAFENARKEHESKPLVLEAVEWTREEGEPTLESAQDEIPHDDVRVPAVVSERRDDSHAPLTIIRKKPEKPRRRWLGLFREAGAE